MKFEENWPRVVFLFLVVFFEEVIQRCGRMTDEWKTNRQMASDHNR